MMPHITSNLITKIKLSPTLEVANRAAIMKASGIDVISLSTGEPDFDTPDNIKVAAIKAINDGFTKYTAIDGIISLKKAIQQKFEKENGLKYNLDQISVSNGAKQIIFNALLSSVNPGDEVIIPSPYWVSYPEMVTFAGGVTIIAECSDEDHFKMTPSILESCITKKTKWLILNSPNNPTGAVYSKDELLEISEILLKYPHVYVMCDDIYEHIIFDNMKFYTLASVEPRLYDRILTINGLSKGYAMTGWRIGYAGGPPELIKALSVVQSQSTSNPCSISQMASVEALTGTQDFLKDNAMIFQKRRDLVMSYLNKTELLSCTKPNGAFYLFPDCSKMFGKITNKGVTLKSSIDVAQYILEEALVAVVPGSAFGADNFFRLSYATSEEKLISALERIISACNKLL